MSDLFNVTTAHLFLMLKILYIENFLLCTTFTVSNTLLFSLYYLVTSGLKMLNDRRICDNMLKAENGSS